MARAESDSISIYFQKTNGCRGRSQAALGIGTIYHTEFSDGFKSDTARSSSAVKTCSTADFLRATEVCAVSSEAREVCAVGQTSSDEPLLQRTSPRC